MNFINPRGNVICFVIAASSKGIKVKNFPDIKTASSANNNREKKMNKTRFTINSRAEQTDHQLFLKGHGL